MTASDELLIGAIDGHVHACAHMNARSLTAIDAARQAKAAGMRAIGLIDNFASSVGLAAMIDREMTDPDFTVFGGLVMEPQAGGLNPRAVAAALGTGYVDADGLDWRGGPLGTKAGRQFISFPTHATRHVALTEGRSGPYLENCLALPESGPLPDPIPEILDLIAQADAVLNTGHLSALEALRLIEAGRARGISRILTPCSLFPTETVLEIVRAGSIAEFSYFFVSHATQVPLTHVDAEPHTIPGTTLAAMAETINRLDPAACIVSSDCGVSILPIPVEGLRHFVSGLEDAGVPRVSLENMIRKTPSKLFGIA